MRIYNEIVKMERAKRAWSQEHLAEVSGLGLRTIQRIKTNGSASFQSTQSIAAALQMSASDLVAVTPSNRVFQRLRQTPWTAASAMCIALIGLGMLFIGGQAFADNIMLDIGITLIGVQYFYA